MIPALSSHCFLVILILSFLDNIDSEQLNYDKSDRLSELKIIDKLLNKYDRRATPTNNMGLPTEVGCEIFIRSFGSLSEKTMDYKVDLYLRQHWVDPRMNHSAITEPLDLNDPKLVQAIWKPEVYFPNAKEAEFQYVTVPNVLLSLKPNGHILYMLRLKLSFSCMMELTKYPLDDQICTMEIASFSKTIKELKLNWKNNEPVELSREVKMPQFVVERVHSTVCEEGAVVGNYSCLVAKFHLSRSIGFHMVQSYIPTILIVIVSWVSFFMDLDSVPGRVTLGVTTLLTVSTKSANLATDSPQVSYVKAIDIWMGACTAFIFAALIEFTFVNYLWRKHCKARRRQQGFENAMLSLSFIDKAQRSRMRKNQTESNETILNDKQAETCLLHNRGEKSCWQNHDQKENGTKPDSQPDDFDVINLLGQENVPLDGLLSENDNAMRWGVRLAIKIDEMCRVIFPVTFIFFNCFYWWYYLSYLE